MVLTLGAGLARDCVTWASCAVSVRATTLDDEVWNNAVEGERIIEVALSKFDEVLDGDRCLLLVELSLHITLLSRDNSVFHDFVFFSVFQILCKDKNKLLNEKEKREIKKPKGCNICSEMCFAESEMSFNI